MKKLFLGLTLAMMACWACGDATKEKKNEVKVEKAGQPEQKVEKIDSTELKRRQQEIIKQDSIQRAEEEKNTRIKQECATKVVFLEIWVFASGNGASNVSYKVNIPSDERSNVFNVTKCVPLFMLSMFCLATTKVTKKAGTQARVSA